MGLNSFPSSGGLFPTSPNLHKQARVSVREFGAVGDGIADDTLALQEAFESGRALHIPVGTYRISATLKPGKAIGTILHMDIEGGGWATIIKAEGPVDGPAIEVGLSGHEVRGTIRNLRISGAATVGLKVTYTAPGFHLDSIWLDQFVAEDGFVFSNMWGCALSNLYTNGATITKACFRASQFTANACSNWYTSNYCEHAFHLTGGSSNTYDGLTGQGADVGMLLVQSGATVSGYYSENVIHPLILGDVAIDQVKHNTFMGCGFAAPGDWHRAYADRIALIQIENASGILFEQCNVLMDLQAQWIVTTIEGGGGAGARAFALARPDGTIHSVTLLYGGSGYTDPPTVALTNPYGDENLTPATVTASVADGKVTALTVEDGGAGYEQTITALRYNDARDVIIMGSLSRQELGYLTAQPLYPWIVRHPDSPDGKGIGITILDDHSWKTAGPDYPAAAELRLAAGPGRKHVLAWYDNDGARQTVIIVPPVYP